MAKHKIFFNLQQDEDGYPPVSVESVWADEVGEGRFALDNVPFFIRVATLGDVVTATPDEGGTLWYKFVVQESTNSLVRVVLFERDRFDELQAAVSRLGCSLESADNLVAINVPQSASLVNLQSYLAKESRAGWLDREEPILRQ